MRIGPSVQTTIGIIINIYSFKSFSHIIIVIIIIIIKAFFHSKSQFQLLFLIF